jgi:hypothetical protein
MVKDLDEFQDTLEQRVFSRKNVKSHPVSVYKIEIPAKVKLELTQHNVKELYEVSLWSGLIALGRLTGKKERGVSLSYAKKVFNSASGILENGCYVSALEHKMDVPDYLKLSKR